MQINKKSLYRTVDANFNRAKEGLRVCEDICRFVFDEKSVTRKLKLIRHQLTCIISSLGIFSLISSRNIEKDVGKQSLATELKRKEIADIFYANSQRVKESIRVLEEFIKLLDKKLAQDLKAIRYKIYAIEKEVVKKF